MKNTLRVGPQNSIYHGQLELLSYIVELPSSSNLGMLRGLAGAMRALENTRLTVAFPFTEE